VPLISCGFSFGAWMAILAGGEDPKVASLLLTGLAVRAQGLEDFRNTGRLRSISKPVAVVQAEKDELGPPHEIEEALAGSIARRRFAIVKGAGHLFVEDLDGLQREAEASLDWLLGAP
jgi:pimeloyl-ACP methyl ester carboxylesterase